MVAYIATNGQRRKPAIRRHGEIIVEQARGIAQDWLTEVRRGIDPSAERATARRVPEVKELFDRRAATSHPRSSRTSVTAGVAIAAGTVLE